MIKKLILDMNIDLLKFPPMPEDNYYANFEQEIPDKIFYPLSASLLAEEKHKILVSHVSLISFA